VRADLKVVSGNAGRSDGVELRRSDILQRLTRALGGCTYCAQKKADQQRQAGWESCQGGGSRGQESSLAGAALVFWNRIVSWGMAQDYRF